MTPAKKKAGSDEAGTEASVDRGPGPELAETLVSVHDDPTPDPVEED